MEDIAPQLLEKIEQGFSRRFQENKKIALLYKKVAAGEASYKEANDFAIEVGQELVNTFKEVLSSDVLPDGKCHYNIAKRILPGPLKNNHDIVADLCADIQKSINKKAGIGIKAIKPQINQDRIDGIVDIVSGKGNFDDIAYMLDEPVINFTESTVDDSVRANAEFQRRAGLRPQIRRTAEANCCEWCSKIAGVYDYDDVKDPGNDVFRRHKECRCLIEFISNGKKTTVNNYSTADTREKRKQKLEDLSKKNLNKMSLKDLKEIARQEGYTYYKKHNHGITNDMINAQVEKLSRQELKDSIRIMRKG